MKSNRIEYLKREISKLEHNIEQLKKMNEKTCRCEMHISGTDIGVDFYFMPLKANIYRPIISHLIKQLDHYSGALYWELKKEEEYRKLKETKENRR